MAEEPDQVNQMCSFYMGSFIDGMNIQNSSKFSCDEHTLNSVMKLYHDLESYIVNLELLSTRLKCVGPFRVKISMALLVESTKEP